MTFRSADNLKPIFLEFSTFDANGINTLPLEVYDSLRSVFQLDGSPIVHRHYDWTNRLEINGQTPGAGLLIAPQIARYLEELSGFEMYLYRQGRCYLKRVNITHRTADATDYNGIGYVITPVPDYNSIPSGHTFCSYCEIVGPKSNAYHDVLICDHCSSIVANTPEDKRPDYLTPDVIGSCSYGCDVLIRPGVTYGLQHTVYRYPDGARTQRDWLCYDCTGRLHLCSECYAAVTTEDRPEYSGWQNHAGDWICPDCVFDMENRCPECGCAPDDCECCAECCRNRDNCECYDDSLIKDYSADVLDYLPIDTGCRRLYGVELELGTYDNVEYAAEIVDALVDGDAILKHDSSIRDDEGFDGFEIVTRPMKFQNLTDFWARVIPQLPADLRAKSTCGLHVHVSKRSLTTLTIGKLVVFLNDERNEEFIKRIAGRYKNAYCYPNPNKKITDAMHDPVKRYEMLNLENRSTVEFRIFAATTRKDKLLARLEFVQAAIEFCEQASCQHLISDRFTAWLERQPGFKHLKELLGLPTKPPRNAKRKAKANAETITTNNQTTGGITAICA
jgi:hypothetical protein